MLSRDASSRLFGEPTLLSRDASSQETVWALIDFAAWCSESGGNQPGTTSGKFAAIQYLHRTQAQVEIDTTSQLTNCALRGIARSQAELSVRRRTRLPVAWSKRRDAENVAQSWDPGGRVMWSCLSLSYYFLIARSVHPAHRLIMRRDVAFFRGDNQLEYMNWRVAERI